MQAAAGEHLAVRTTNTAIVVPTPRPECLCDVCQLGPVGEAELHRLVGEGGLSHAVGPEPAPPLALVVGGVGPRRGRVRGVVNPAAFDPAE